MRVDRERDDVLDAQRERAPAQVQAYLAREQQQRRPWPGATRLAERGQRRAIALGADNDHERHRGAARQRRDGAGVGALGDGVAVLLEQETQHSVGRRVAADEDDEDGHRCIVHGALRQKCYVW